MLFLKSPLTINESSPVALQSFNFFLLEVTTSIQAKTVSETLFASFDDTETSSDAAAAASAAAAE